MGSPAGSLAKTDWLKVAKMFAIYGFAGALTWLVSFIPSLNLGNYQEITGLLLGAVLHIIQRYLSDNG